MATSTERLPERWLEQVTSAGSGIIERDVLSRAEQADELLMMSLRLSEGLDLDRLAAIGGVRPGQRSINTLTAGGHIELDADARRLRATRAGSFVLNEVVLQLSADFEAI